MRLPVEARESLERERLKFRVDHCQAGKLLLNEWGLPRGIGSAAASHHDDPRGAPSNLNDAVNLACRLASSIGYPANSAAPVWEVERIASFLPLSGEGAAILNPAELREAIARKLSIVG